MFAELEGVNRETIIVLNCPASLSIDAPRSTISIKGTTLAATIKIKDISSIGLQQYKFFLDSKPISVKVLSQDTFQVDASYVPTGVHRLDVVGVCTDGVAIASESVSLRISNPLLDAERARNERINKAAALLAKVTKLDESIVSLYEQALREPDLRTVQTIRLLTVSEWEHSASVTIIDTWQISGNAGKLLGECKARIMERARVAIEIGQVYSKLGRTEEALVWLQFALDSTGETNATEIFAKSELNKLKRAS